MKTTTMIEIEEEEEDQKIEKETAEEKPYWYKIGMIFSIVPIFLWSIISIVGIILAFTESLRIPEIVDFIFSEINVLNLFSIAFLIISSKIYNRHKTLSIILLLFPFVSFCLHWLYVSYY
jgi:hypothetical protein